jgi:hypothetical protein
MPGRSALFEGIYATLLADPSLVPGILGPRTVTNQRLYRAFPQQSPQLTEPSPPDGEGWLVLEEIMPGLRASLEQLETIHEATDVDFHIFSTRYSLGDAAVDVLDATWHWTVEQQRALQYGDRIVLFTRRMQSFDKYAQETKLYEKVSRYRVTLVPEVIIR